MSRSDERRGRRAPFFRVFGRRLIVFEPMTEVTDTGLQQRDVKATTGSSEKGRLSRSLGVDGGRASRRTSMAAPGGISCRPVSSIGTAALTGTNREHIWRALL